MKQPSGTALPPMSATQGGALPPSSTKQIENVGTILLSVQKEMEKVRTSLDALPTQSSSSFDSLRLVLEKAEDNLREQAEHVFKTVVDNSVRTIPLGRRTPAAASSSTPVDASTPAHADNAYTSRAGTSASAERGPSAAGILSGGRAASAGGTYASFVRSARDRMLNEWENEVIADPQRAAHARRVLDERFLHAIASQGGGATARHHTGAAAGAVLSLSGTGAPFPLLLSPHEPTTVSSSPIVAALEAPFVPVPASQAPRASQALLRRGRELHHTTAPHARALPAANRRDPFEPLPPLTPMDAQRGVFNLMAAGLVDPHTDMTPALGPGTGLVRNAPVTFHAFEQQFARTAKDTAPYVPGANTTKLEIQRLGALGLPTGTETNALSASNDSSAPYVGGHEIAPSATVVEQVRAAQEQRKQQQPQQHAEQAQRQMAAPAAQTERAVLPAPSAPALPPLKADAAEAAMPRGFDELLDAYSLHQFLIRKGATMAATPEFVSFRRTHAPAWTSIKIMIAALEAHLVRVNAPLAIVDGVRLAELAAAFDLRNTGSTAAQPTQSELLACLVNADAVQPLFASRVHKYVGASGRELAATKIQATWKMFVCRKYYKFDRRRFVAARVVQRCWRLYTRHMRTRRLIAAAWAAKLEGWRRMMQSFRERWPRIVRRRRVVVHIPSLSFTCAQRESIHNFTTRENGQFARLCAVADPLVDVVYVSPVPVSDEVRSYYLKLLEVGGVKNAEARVKFLVPENAQRFHDHMSLAQKLYYSPKCMRRLLQCIRKREAYIVPNQVGPEDLLLAVHLHLPLWAPEPEVAALFSSKSGAKRIFEAAALNMPPGVRDVWSEDEFYLGLSRLILKHLDVQRWLFKIDDESGGRGTAWFEPAELKIYEQLLQERQSIHWDAPETRALTLERVRRALQRTLPAKVQFACPHIYENQWAKYLDTLLVAGAVIEACPPSVTGSPSVNLLIEPDGSVTVVSSHDQIFARPYVYAGALFPQQSVPPEALSALAQALGRACYANGVIGAVGVDLVAVFDHARDSLRLFAVDLNLRTTETAAAFQLFDFLMNGRTRVDGTYQIDGGGSSAIARGSMSAPPPHRRFYATVNYIFQPHLGAIQYRAFFHLCRLKGIAFDLQHRDGTAFVLNDSLAGGTLGVLSVGDAPLQALSHLAKALDFLQEQVGALPTSEHLYAHEINLRDIHVAIKTIVKAQASADE